jgi:sterol 24-C-methyltransferase
MAQSLMKSKLQFKAYRLLTVLKSLKTLYTLPQDKIDAFLNSYDIYDHDWADEEELIQNMGADYYEQVKKKLVDYYSVLNHLCAIGQVEKMYIPPAMDLSASIIANQELYEQKMCRDLGIRKGDHVLDIGCGRGRIASHVATYTGADVTGMNIDPNQIDCAKRYAEGNGLHTQCHFKVADMNDLPLPFPDQSFDFVYQVQAFSLCKNLEKLFQDIHRMLKPGGKLACLDWVRFPKYDETNPHHASLMKRIKPLIGAIGTPSVDEFVTLLEKTGFKVRISENASVGGLQAPLIENADRFFTRVTRLIKFLVGSKLLPKHFQALFDRLTKDGEAFVEADRLGLITTSYYIVAEKH